MLFVWPIQKFLTDYYLFRAPERPCATTAGGVGGSIQSKRKFLLPADRTGMSREATAAARQNLLSQFLGPLLIQFFLNGFT
jgi:hypothetical protein